MEIQILDNYDFLEELVRDGQLDPTQPFLKDGICYADEKRHFVYVFHFYKSEIWATYGYRKYNNKDFLEFHNKIATTLLKTGLPVLRIGKNNDLKKSFKLYKTVDNVPIYRLIERKK